MPRLNLAKPTRDVLIAGLDVFTREDFAANPPKEKETLEQLGIASGKIDTSLRAWINKRFLEPAGEPLLLKGKLKPSTKFSELCKICGV